MQKEYANSYPENQKYLADPYRNWDEWNAKRYQSNILKNH